ncbi:MAG: GNAT family N-acetyltransferase [Devosia nanyangense]|nr:GNAT family N-acetyltransferase [Devosia nanyangense]
MIELPSVGVIGAVGIAPNLGYWMSQEHWGRGYMTEAAERLVAWYFGVTDAPDVIHCSARLENAASRAVQRKLGFRGIGTSEGFSRPLNEPYIAMQTELDRKAFEERGR